MSRLHQAATLLAWGTVLVLPACALPAPSAGGSSVAPTAATDAQPSPAGRPCNAAAAQAAVGQIGTAQLADWARLQAGARKVRVIGHDGVITRDYDTARLNLQLDAGGKVVRVYCG